MHDFEKKKKIFREIEKEFRSKQREFEHNKRKIILDSAKPSKINLDTNFFLSQEQRNEIFSETSSRIYRELCGPEGVVLQQKNILQQVMQEVHHDSNLHSTINEQQENIGQIIHEIYRLREELAKVNSH